MPAAGKLITLEGLDGSGKTTLAAGLLSVFPALTLLREPGGVGLAERVRALVTDPALDVDPRAEALLYAAARAQLVAERVRPLLAGGHDVLLDRFADSSSPTRAPAAGSASRRSGRSTRSRRAGWFPTRRCCCASIR